MSLKLAREAIMSGAITASMLGFAGTLFLLALYSVQSAERRQNIWEGPPVTIALDETRLVRCGKIDRGQPSCTMLSECDDQVDRCVITFEIFRRPVLPGELEPADQSK